MIDFGVQTGVTIVSITHQVVKRLCDYFGTEDTPSCIRHVKAQLPYIAEKLDELKKNDKSKKLYPLINEFEAILNRIEHVIQKLHPKSYESVLKKSVRVAGSFYYEDEIDDICKDIEHYKTTFLFYGASIDRLEVEKVESDVIKNHYLYPKSVVSYFVSRKEILDKIASAYSDEKINIKILLTGMAGSGKTQIGLEYCHQCEVSNTFSSIFWINASSLESIEESLHQIAITVDHGVDPKTPTAAINIIERKLDNSIGKLLVVFDEISSDVDIDKYFIKGAYIMFLSKSTIPFSDLVINVDKMLENEALQLFFHQARCKRSNSNTRIASKLISSVGFHALAIDQIAMYISSYGLDLDQFKYHYNSNQERIFKELPKQWYYVGRNMNGDTIPMSVYDICQDMLYNIDNDEDKDSLWEFLSISCYFNKEGIFESLFKVHFSSKHPSWMDIFSSNLQWNNVKYRRILDYLSSHLLILNVREEKDELLFDIHPLIQEYIQLQLDASTKEEKIKESISILINYVDSPVIGGISNDFKEIILSHASTCEHHEASLLNYNDLQSPLCSKIINLLKSHATVEDIEDVKGFKEFKELEILKELEKSEQPEQPDSNEIRSAIEIESTTSEDNISLFSSTTIVSPIANSTADNDKDQYSKKEIEKLLQAAKVDYDNKRYHQAEEKMIIISNDYEQRISIKNPEAVMVLIYLGFSYFHQKKFDKSAKILELAENRRAMYNVNIQGETSKLWSRLAISYVNTNQKPEAAQQFAKSAYLVRKVMDGPTAPSTIEYLEYLTDVYFNCGNWAKFKTSCKEIHDYYLNCYGPSFTGTVDALQNLGVGYLHLGEWNKAINSLSSVVNTQRDSKVSTPESVSALYYLAKAYVYRGKKNDYETIIFLFEKALKGYEEVFEKEHEKTLEVAYDLGHFYFTRGIYAKSEELFIRVLDGRLKLFGWEHKDTLAAAHGLARAYCKRLNLKKAEELLERIVKEYQKRFGDRNDKTLRAIVDLADVYMQSCEYVKAKSLITMDTYMAVQVNFGGKDIDSKRASRMFKELHDYYYY